MHDLLNLTALDGSAMQLTELLRWGPMTSVAALVSAAWVKGPLLFAIGACGDCTN